MDLLHGDDDQSKNKEKAMEMTNNREELSMDELKNNEKAKILQINREELDKVETTLDKELEKAKGEIEVKDAMYLEVFLTEVRDKCEQGLQDLRGKLGDEYKLLKEILEKKCEKKMKAKKEKYKGMVKNLKEKHREEKIKLEEKNSVLEATCEERRWN